MANFLKDTGFDLADLYSGTGNAPRGWTALRRKAGLLSGQPSTNEEAMSSKMCNLIGWNDPLLLQSVIQVGENPSGYQGTEANLNILAAELFPAPKDPCTGGEVKHRLESELELCHEISQLGSILLDNSDVIYAADKNCPKEWPFAMHARYGRRTIEIGSNKLKPNSRYISQGGVIRCHDEKIELILVQLDKTSGFSETTSYHDYAISPSLFHWQSQNSAGPETKAGKRYFPGNNQGWRFMMFVREDDTSLYSFLGEVISRKAEGGKPISVTFEFKTPIPSQLFQRFSVLRAS